MTLEHEKLIEHAAVSAVTAAWTAVPDFVSGAFGRRVARGAIVAGGIAVVVTMGARTQREVVDLADVIDEEVSACRIEEPDDTAESTLAATPCTVVGERIPERYRPALAALAVGGVVLASVASMRMQQKIDDAAAGFFAARGATRPYTMTGLTWGAAAFALSALTGRNRSHSTFAALHA